jgi:hypothetical protein
MKEGILLLSGKVYSYDDPLSNVITIEDIAIGLSKICRYLGQVPYMYTVAQHSVYVSYAIEPEYALEGLLHDATEAVLGDCPTPLKAKLPDYKRMERLHESYMMSRFGLDYPMRPEVHVADKAVFAAEIRDLRPDDWDHYDLSGIEPFEMEIEPWPCWVAREMFLQRYQDLMALRVIN